MSPADDAPLLTPLMRLRQRKRRTMLFAALLTLLIVVLGATVLLVNSGRNLARVLSVLGIQGYDAGKTIPIPAPTGARRYQRSQRIATPPPRLVRPLVEQPDAFQPVGRKSAHERCGELAEEGAPPPAFKASGGEWECVYSSTVGTSAEPSVIFVQARGTSPMSFHSVRLKLSFLEAGADEALVEAAMGALGRFDALPSPDARRYLKEKLTARTDISSSLQDVRLELNRERGDERRYNLLITPDTVAGPCDAADRLAAGAPMRASLNPVTLSCLPLQPAVRPEGSRAVQPQ